MRRTKQTEVTIQVPWLNAWFIKDTINRGRELKNRLFRYPIPKDGAGWRIFHIELGKEGV